MRRSLLTATAKRLTVLFFAALVLLLSVAPCDAQIFHKKKKQNQSTDASNTAEPDKILYDRSMNNIKRGRHEVGRLSLQTLINTYPDSEYLAKAKLAIADSYFKEGGTANLTQAIAGYKDFIVFFPFLKEAAYAQLQVAMTHYQQMEKPDRDRTQAKEAEYEFQTFLQKYPNDPLAPAAEQHLRDVQEVLAEGDFRVGYYYFVKGDSRAAAARLISVTRRYPLYSRSDTALWMLAGIFEKSERKDIAGLYYARIVREYPMSRLVPDAKTKLTAIKVPVPQPDPKALSWMQAEQKMPRPHESLVHKPLGLLRSGPGKELRVAARAGAPNLEPEVDNTSATDILSGGSHATIGGGSGAGTTAIVATVTPGKADSSSTSSGAENAAPAGGENDAASPAGDSNSAANPAAPAASTDTPPATTDAAKTDGTPDTAQAATDAKKQKESTSKKKKGIRKIIPW